VDEGFEKYLLEFAHLLTFYSIKCIRQNLTPGCHGNALFPIELPL